MAKKTISKSNNLITSHFNLSMNEYRVLLYGVSLVNPLNKEFPREFKINIQEFAKMFNIEPSNLYRDVRDTIDKQMFPRYIRIKMPDGWVGKFHLVDFMKYHDELGEIEIHFSIYSMQLLSDFKANFTSYHIEQIALFNSAYSIRFYEFAVMHMKANHGKPTQFFITIDELKRRFDITDKYKLYSNFKIRVIEKAMTEINAFSNISLRYVEIKKGRSVDQIKLIVKYKNWEKAEHQHTINFDPTLKL
jgi:plasmid replication initiation protein